MDEERRIKPVTELTFADDFMFGAIMQDADVCAKVIERLLKIRVDHIEYPELQKVMNPYYERKGVRFDVYVADSERVFDIEIQTYNIADIGKRMRYYQSMLDIDSLMRGADYTELKETYIIFLCQFDPFRLGLPVYTFERTCREDGGVTLGDATSHKVFNCKAFEKEEDADLRAFMAFVSNNRAEDDFTKELEAMVTTKKFQQSFINEYMAWSLHDRDMLEKGKAEGMAKGEHKRAVESARNFLKMGLSVEQVAQGTGLSVAEVKGMRCDEDKAEEN